MADSLCILCPGQGAQTVGMGKELFDASEVARATFAQAAALLGWDLADVCFSGPEERLNQTDVSQPAIYVTSVASFRVASLRGGLPSASVTACAGLSLGEYTALHLAGAVSFEDGLKLVAARGRLMQQAAEARPGAMVAIIGADEAAATELCRSCAQGDVLVPANFNAPGQIVLSGSRAACQRVVPAAEAAGFRATPLKVAGAFHSPLMQAAADQMRPLLETVALAAPTAMVYSNVTARPHEGPDSIRRLLVEQIVSPVRWDQTMTALMGSAGMRFIELAPGRTLAGLAKRINRRLQVEPAPLEAGAA